MEQGVGNMYHISKDVRAVKSAKLIGKGMLKCLESKSFSNITVSDVQRTSGVGRATFYRLFDNTSDVLSYLCDEIFEQTTDEYRKLEILDTDDMTIAFIQIWMEHKTLLKGIADSNRMDFIYKSHMKYLSPAKEYFFPNNTMDETQMTYLMTVMTTCISAVMTTWLKAGAKESAEEVHGRLRACFRTMSQIYG